MIFGVIRYLFALRQALTAYRRMPAHDINPGAARTAVPGFVEGAGGYCRRSAAKVFGRRVYDRPRYRSDGNPAPRTLLKCGISFIMESERQVSVLFIKRTRVKTSRGDKFYLQMVHTYYDNGHVRQRLIANLGREDKIDPAYAAALVRALNEGKSDALPAEQIGLLKTRAYGDLFLLANIFNWVGLQRFFSDVGILKNGRASLADDVFIFVAYAILCKDVHLDIDGWLDTYYLLGKAKPSGKRLLEAVGVLCGKDIVSNAVCSMWEAKAAAADRKNDMRLHFVSKTRIRRGGLMPKAVDMDVVMDSDLLPRCVLPSKQGISDARPGDCIVGEAYGSIEAMAERLGQSGLQYILKYDPHGEPDAFARRLRELGMEKGEYLPLEGRGFRESRLGSRRIVIFRPQPGFAPEISAGFKEPRDIFIANTDMDCTRFGRLIACQEMLSEHLLEFVYPPDPGLDVSNVYDTVFNVALIKLICFHYIEARVEDGWLAEDVLSVMREIRAAEITCGKSSRLVHTCFSPRQSAIAQSMDLTQHPRLGPELKNRGRTGTL